MAPTLYGVHAWVECPNCGTRAAVSLGTDRETGRLNVAYRNLECATVVCEECSFPNQVIADGGVETGSACQACGKPLKVGPLAPARGIPLFRAESGAGGWDNRLTCPMCGFRWNDVIREGNAAGGHKILVNKFYYRLISPRPWDVIVFRFNRKTNYIKRLVGLPGDRVQIRDGDVYRNEKISRKPASAQKALWTPIHDSDRAEAFEKYNAPAWVPADASAGPALWRWTEARTLVFNAAGDRAAVRYGRDCRNFYAYDQLAYGQREASMTSQQLVGDRRIEFTLAWAGGRGGLRITLEDGPDLLSAWIPAPGAGSSSPAFLERARPGTSPERAVAAAEAG
ncbi:MAG: signal peptidase I, partial [Planctomycetes bacterium]|nr:signal peptidase I [Planctomycetota bacterium]